MAIAVLTIGVRFAFSRRDKPNVAKNGNITSEEFFRLTRAAQWVGPPSAPVVILLYSDYLCGFCKELNDLLATLRQRYPQHLALAIKHFVAPSKEPQALIPIAAECAADQEGFIEFHNAAFASGRVLEYSEGWRYVASGLSLPDTAAFTSCVLGRRYATRIAEHFEEARRLGVRLTPTLYVNGRVIVGVPPLEHLDSAIARHFPGRQTSSW
ncbi:MAG: DsbA family protein [Longimicrobiales bacterium]